MRIKRDSLICKIAAVDKDWCYINFWELVIKFIFCLFIVWPIFGIMIVGPIYLFSFLFGKYPDWGADAEKDQFIKDFKKWPNIFGFRIIPIWVITVAFLCWSLYAFWPVVLPVSLKVWDSLKFVWNLNVAGKLALISALLMILVKPIEFFINSKWMSSFKKLAGLKLKKLNTNVEIID